MIEVIGAPFDLTGARLGSRLGPPAIRLAGLLPVLSEILMETHDTGDITVLEPLTHEGGMRNFPSLFDAVVKLKERTTRALKRGKTPLILGGEHALVMGSISAALNTVGDDLAVVWIDAHADINTPGSSETGNIHGMPIAALQGLPSETAGIVDDEWSALLESLGPHRLRPQNTIWFGLRDVDQAERTRLTGLPITMQGVDRFGIEPLVDQIDTYLRRLNVPKVWISFDVDVLDPILAPGTGTAVRGGLSYREGHLLAELLCEKLGQEDCPYDLVGLDVVETNPLFDTNNSTAVMAVEWVASLFGKTII